MERPFDVMTQRFARARADEDLLPRPLWHAFSGCLCRHACQYVRYIGTSCLTFSPACYAHNVSLEHRYSCDLPCSGCRRGNDRLVLDQAKDPLNGHGGHGSWGGEGHRDLEMPDDGEG